MGFLCVALAVSGLLAWWTYRDAPTRGLGDGWAWGVMALGPVFFVVYLVARWRAKSP